VEECPDQEAFLLEDVAKSKTWAPIRKGEQHLRKIKEVKLRGANYYIKRNKNLARIRRKIGQRGQRGRAAGVKSDVSSEGTGNDEM